MPSIEKKESGLKKSLGLIFVYTVAAFRLAAPVQGR